MIRPWVPALDAVLQYKRMEKTKTWPSRYVHTEIKLYAVDNNTGVTYGGLYDMLHEAMLRLRIPFVVEDHRKPLPAAQWDKISKDLRQGQDVVLAAISVSHNGVIDCPTAFGKSFIITQLTLMYPDLKILVVTPGKQVVESLFKRIKEETKQKVIQVRAGKKFNEHADVVVCTAASLHNIPTDWPDLLLFDECHGAPAPLTQEKLIKFSSCRMFGFSASPDGRGDNADVVVEAFFGRTMVKLSYQEAVDSDTIVPIEVYLRRVTCEDIETNTDVEREREGYWQNTVRNLSIAEVAKNVPEHMQTLIMVKTTEHAVRLLALLPDFEMVHGGKDKNDWAFLMQEGALGDDWYTQEEISPYVDAVFQKGYTDMYEIKRRAETALLVAFTKGDAELSCYTRYGQPDATAFREKFEDGSLKKVIATTIWKEGIDPVHLRVLIRADGSSGNIPSTQIPGRLARRVEGKSMGILIDFVDCYGGNFYRRSQKRIGHYRKKEWRIHEDWNGRFTPEMGSI